jgi:type II restriction/modification system DNA methylase subunit YeeA
MTPAEFIKKWSDSRLRERQASQEHFLDLCRLLEEPTPAEADPLGDTYCFERGAAKTGGGDGWADVWRKGCFGWEYKGKHKDLGAAERQLLTYSRDLQNPPYHVVSDMERIIINTAWTNAVSRRIELKLDDLHEPTNLAILKAVFQGSDSLKPKISPQELTAKVAQRFGALGRRLQERGHDPREVAHFLNRIVFCMFAEDAGLLPLEMFSRMMKAVQIRPPEEAAGAFDSLFAMMAKGGLFGADVIRHFNGGLFDDKPALPLERPDLKEIADTAAEHNWSEIDPSVFGNMFEEALKATRERAALGAHYTDREKILKIVDPVIVRPLTAEWEAALDAIRAALGERDAAEAERKAVLDKAAEAMKADPVAAKAGEAGRRKAIGAAEKKRSAAVGRANDILETFLARLANYRVLDPACGSGNFLYVALHALKDLERRALVDAERAGLVVPAPRVGLACVRGIEIEDYAAELARVTLWIGDLQWNARNNYTGLSEPILSSLDQIENRDALLNADGTEAVWPEADAIIGNPPFLGDKKMVADLGEAYVETLRAAYKGRVPGGADFVCYWVEKAWRAVEASGGLRGGLVTTNSIRSGASRRVVDPIATADCIWDAWADEPWVQAGAAVRVSMLSFGHGFTDRHLNGAPVNQVHSDLTAGDVDVTQRHELRENRGACFVGVILNGGFEVDGTLARSWLAEPSNVNARPNSDVLRPTLNGDDFNGTRPDKWIVDFGTDLSEPDAALYQSPFEYIATHVRPYRQRRNEDGEFLVRATNERENWWRHARPRPAMRKALAPLARYIATPMVSSFRTFGYLHSGVLPDQKLVVFSWDDDLHLGILQSNAHDVWTKFTCSWIGSGNDITYSNTSTFMTFPFPEGLTPNIPAADYTGDPRAQAIAEAAAELNRLREAWLNPPDLVRIEPEVVAGYPDRVLPRDAAAAAVLKKRTLTNLYNDRPAWLAMAHQRLDAAVAAAYGWPADLSDEAVLERLFALNQERAAAGR